MFNFRHISDDEILMICNQIVKIIDDNNDVMF